jgi:uncharacterized membrane protein
MTPLIEPANKAPGFFMRLWRQLSRYLVAGLLVWVPLLITLWISWLLVSSVGDAVEAVFGAFFRAMETRIPAWLKEPGTDEISPFWTRTIGIAFVLALFFVTGFLARYVVGRKIIAAGESIVRRIPLVSRIYGATQQIRDVFVGRQGAVFQKVCLVEYPRKGVYAVAFATSDEYGLVQERVGKELVAVFMPSTPNPTTGFLMYLEPSEIHSLDVTVEEAMKLIISGGAYIPGYSDKGLEESTPLHPSADVVESVPSPESVRARRERKKQQRG